MQKQESFYYQARAGAPTNTDAAAIGRSPELWITLLIQSIITRKIWKTGVSGSDWSPSGEGLGVEFWLVLLSRVDSNFPGWPRVLIGSQVVGWGQGISKGSFQRLFSRKLTKWSSLDSSVSEGDKYAKGRQPYSLYCKSRNVWLLSIRTLLIGTSGFPGGSAGKEPTCNEGGLGRIPGLGRSPGEGNGYPFQYSCLKNSMDRGHWWATVHRVTKDMTEWLTLK